MKQSKKKKSKNLALKSLHSALRGLLDDPKFQYGNPSKLIKPPPREKEDKVEKKKRKHHITKERKRILSVGGGFDLRDDDQHDYFNENESLTRKNGIIYIKSRENVLIPKLTDDEVMERHKKADETMKEVWTNIINKYESMKNQGDLINLQTGEIIEDNGHIKGLNHEYTNTETVETRYKSTLKDILDINDGDELDDEYSIWQGEEERGIEDDMGDLEENNSGE
ncbi:hypothetical protein NCAS_0A13890 [Naumovozyma castellii]|uniref:Uncharacterized protein n=1 Tax=Naumovozyma castellii TaxID=27288 RepID=G0V8Z8_NAUCA|nr:hypothetical protein NCAS_0A13890 [Naumovozyma castellii CBS 4309]CCC67947.1 hypothetical protein NCAS_0A13890 [Naumovozyma castellii CBS 4309]